MDEGSWIQPKQIRGGGGKVLPVGQAVVVNHPQVSAELEGVVVFRPGNVIYEVMYRHSAENGSRGTIECAAVVQATEYNEVFRTFPRFSCALPNKSVTKVVDEGIGEERSVACGNSFTVIRDKLVRR